MLRMTEQEILGGENKKCKVGERFRLGACNYCYCNEHGVRICSRHNCNYKSDVNKTKYSPKQYKEEQCKIGYRFRLDTCNYCYCNEHRKLICSKHKCEGSIPPPAYLRSPFDMDCEVGHVLVDSCIICTCTENKTYVCVPENKDECEPLDISQRINSDEDRCVDGSKRPVNDCNYCICRDGIEFCTQKPCWNNIQTPYIFLEPECDEDTPIPSPDPCNTCICVDSDILCTNIPCIHHTRTSDLSIVNQKYCVNGEVHSMNDGCNLCICMNKKIICTKKRCYDIFRSGVTELEMVHSLLQSAYSQSQMTQSAPGSDCSQNKLYRPEDDDPDCPNVCICDGNELLCTRRKCDTKVSTFIKAKTGFRSRPTRYEPLKRHVCNEGDQIPTDSSCLVCVCLHGGPVCKPVRCSENPNLRYDSDDESEEFKKFFKGLLGTQNNFNKPGKDSTFCKPFTFFSPNGNRFCRNCFCLHNGLALCLLGLCKYHRDDHKPIVRVDQKKPCVPGDVARPGRCVYCTCTSKAVWSCGKADTDMTTCKNAICEENDEFHMGFSPYCAECKCILNQRYCSIDVKSCPDYSDVKCPIGTIIQNPREFCSICVCGGYDDGAKNMCFTESKCVKQVINHYTL
ncbi:kielin/chordin-like protein [Spodoptera litura]|uniref:Kielin/chordin-like protein n=1 Tax=Spodoptera litura TaxID=69820 RepID=A0A9J7EP00_SPOLT|nr:kielin/chordin-like protein [Spodoptera litura]